MREYEVRAGASDQVLAREDQLAWRLAEVASPRAPLDDDVRDMVVNRVIDDAAVATASLARPPVAAARDQARRHPARPGATVVGLDPDERVSPEWAAWANAVAVRELDFHDTFLAAEYAHPGDAIAPLVAVAQHVGGAVDGDRLVRAIANAYEVQISLARAISLHAHAIDHVAHLAPAIAVGLGTLLDLPTPVVFQAVNQSVHVTTATRQSRKGTISTWKAYAPAFAAKAAIEAVDRAMRGETAPEPIYEGADAVIARLLDGPGAGYHVTLVGPDEPRRAILDSFTKEHSAEYQAQAWIDLARRLRAADPRLATGVGVAEIVLHTSHHTHAVIGSGSGDPQKYDPAATRETLDHSLPYILAVALQDGAWHHERSYAPTRAARPDTVALWRSIRTLEDPEWTARYHDPDPTRRAYGGRAEILFTDGTRREATVVVPDAHPAGERPFGRAQYVAKFRQLTEGVLAPAEVERFLDLAARLPELLSGDLAGLTVTSEVARPILTTGLL